MNLIEERIALFSGNWFWCVFSSHVPIIVRKIGKEEYGGQDPHALVEYNQESRKMTMVIDPKKLEERKPKFEHRIGTIMHELLHIARLHIFQKVHFFESTPLTEETAALVAIAQDLEVNQYIPKELLSPINPTIEDKNFEFPPKLPWTDYYKLLEQRVKGNKLTVKNENNEILVIINKNGKGQMEAYVSSTQVNIQRLSKSEVDLLQAQIVDAINKTIDQVKIAQGTIPGDLESLLQLYATPPKVSWQETLRMFPEMCGSSALEYHKKYRDKRYGMRPALRHKNNRKLLICVDTSGSVSDNSLVMFFNEIIRIADDETDMVVAQIDYEIQKVTPYFTGYEKTIEIRGRGGTSFVPMVKLLQEGYYDGVIYLTDLMGDFPEAPAIPVLWVSVSRGEAPFGRVVVIDEQD